MVDKKSDGGNASGDQDSDDTDSEFEELDPSGRYGRAFRHIKIEGDGMPWNETMYAER